MREESIVVCLYAYIQSASSPTIMIPTTVVYEDFGPVLIRIYY